MRVDLPAPFSPTMPWIVPRRTVRSMSWFARTGPNDFEMPESLIAGGAAVAEGVGASVIVVDNVVPHEILTAQQLPFRRVRGKCAIHKGW